MGLLASAMRLSLGRIILAMSALQHGLGRMEGEPARIDSASLQRLDASLASAQSSWLHACQRQQCGSLQRRKVPMPAYVEMYSQVQ